MSKVVIMWGEGETKHCDSRVQEYPNKLIKMREWVPMNSNHGRGGEGYFQINKIMGDRGVNEFKL